MDGSFLEQHLEHSFPQKMLTSVQEIFVESESVEAGVELSVGTLEIKRRFFEILSLRDSHQ